MLGLAIISLLSLVACKGVHLRKAEVEDDTAPHYWPAPPEPVRVVYVGSMHRPADAGIKVSGFRRVANLFTGSAKGREPLLKPFGIALDEKDNLCITDTGAGAVIYLDRAKKSWTRWDRIGKTSFISPVGVTKRGDTFFVADSGLGAILAFNERGKLLFQTTNHLERPTGLTIVGNRLFASDSKRHAVVSLDLSGHYLSEFGHRGAGQGEFNFPTHIASNANGDLLITDSLNSRVQVFDSNGNFKSQIGSMGDSTGQFSRPKGVAVDAFGHVYVIDALFDNIQIFDLKGALLLNFGASGNEPGEFWLANGIAISHSNEIYVTDSYNHRIQIFRYVGEP